MKLFIIYFIFLSIQMSAQSYINVLFSDGSYKNSQISSLRKITLNSIGDSMSFHSFDGHVSIESVAEIQKLTLDSLPLGQPLPVELSAFAVLLLGSAVDIRWRTETEVTNFGFEVQRNHGIEISIPWTKIGFVEGNGTSNSPKDYSYTDILTSDDIYHYRLKQIDTDGRYEYSSVVSIRFTTPVHYVLNQNYPNPFNPSTNISYTIPKDGFVTLKIYDSIGREISNLVNENQKAGSYTTNFDAGKYASGIYFCRINSGNFSSSIKMILLK